jgi:hypothetical protein
LLRSNGTLMSILSFNLSESIGRPNYRARAVATIATASRFQAIRRCFWLRLSAIRAMPTLMAFCLSS